MRRDTGMCERALRVLVCALAVLFAFEPSAAASGVCPIAAWSASRQTCCCSERGELAPSCCSADDEAAASVESRCECRLQSPGPLPALPRESGARGIDGEKDLQRWIETGALASASTAVPVQDFPRDEARVRSAGGLPGLLRALEALAARGVRGFLAEICVARC